MAKPRARIQKQSLSGNTSSGIPIQQDVPDGNDARPLLRFTHVNTNKYCLSKCKKQDIVALMALFKKIEERTWKQIYATAGKGYGKHGVAYERVSTTALPTLPSTTPKDAQPFELRANDSVRIFAYRGDDNTCNLLFFDPKHRILS